MVAKRKCESSDDTIERKKKSFRFSEEMISSLVDCLSDYKVKCEFSNIDFDADKVLQYKSIQSAMVAEYQNYKEYFSPAMARED